MLLMCSNIDASIENYSLLFTRDISAAPANPAQLQYVDLYMESPSGGSLFVSRLATNVDVKPGSLSIVVPQVRTGKYFVMGESLETTDLTEGVIFTLLCYSWQIRAQQCTLLNQCVISCGGNPTRTFIGRTPFLIVLMVPLLIHR